MFSKRISFLTICVCFSVSILATSCSPQAKQPSSAIGPAGIVVRIYCEQDALGMLLSGSTIGFSESYLSIETLPGSDGLYIIDNFKIIKEKYTGKTAFVDVRYHITGETDGNQNIAKTDKHQTLHFKLKMSDDMWKIIYISGSWEAQPHVYMGAYKKHMAIVNDLNSRCKD